jgi:hypothetical protein
LRRTKSKAGLKARLYDHEDIMIRARVLFALAIIALAPATRVSAQLLAAKDGPIVYGHHHLVVTSVPDHKKFWVDTLGGAAITIGTQNREIVRFPNALLFMNPGKPTGGSRGSTVNHLGFSVPNLRQTVDKLKAGGFKMVTASEAPAAVKVQDDIGLTSGGDVSGLPTSWDRTTSRWS